MGEAPDFVQLARGWIGTPYAHQASCKGAGCDCLGLILGIWREAGGIAPALPAYSRDWSEAAGLERLWQGARRHLHPRNGAPLAGDVLLFRMRDGAVAKHLGILSQSGPAPRFIHAMSGHGVLESALTAPWARRVVARFAFPEMINGG